MEGTAGRGNSGWGSNGGGGWDSGDYELISVVGYGGQTIHVIIETKK